MGNKNKKTHFGYKEVNEADKRKYVGEVFTSVAKNYDIMNDATVSYTHLRAHETR